MCARFRVQTVSIRAVRASATGAALSGLAVSFTIIGESRPPTAVGLTNRMGYVQFDVAVLTTNLVALQVNVAEDGNRQMAVASVFIGRYARGGCALYPTVHASHTLPSSVLFIFNPHTVM